MKLFSLLALVMVLSISLVIAEPAISPTPLNGISPAQFDLSGHGFTVLELRKGEIAFRGRPYVWDDVPSGLEGLRFTQGAAGVPSKIHLKINTPGTIFIVAAANNMLELKDQGWSLPTPDRSNTFCYTDPNRTLMIVLSRVVNAGQELDLPQLGFTGCILLLAAGP